MEEKIITINSQFSPTYHGEDGGSGEERPVPHVCLDGGEDGGPGKAEHDRTESLTEIHWRLWLRVLWMEVNSVATGVVMGVDHFMEQR